MTADFVGKYIIVHDNRSLNCEVTVNDADDGSSLDKDEYLYILHISLCVLSIVVSLLNIFIFTRPGLRTTSINTLLLAIELSSLIQSLHYLPICVMKYAYPVTFYFNSVIPHVQTYLEIVMQSSVNFTVWMTALVAVWRCIAVVWPLKANCLLTLNKARIAMVGIASFSTIFITSVYMITLHVYEYPLTLCVKFENGTVVANLNSYYLSVLNLIQACWLSLLLCLVFFVIPTVLSTAATIWMLWTIRISMQIRKSIQGSSVTDRSDTTACIRTTLVLTIMLFAFSISNFSPYLTALLTVANNNNNFTTLPEPLNYIVNEYVLGLAVNCLSIIGFYFVGTKFRETLLSYTIRWKRRKHDHKVRENVTNLTYLSADREIYLPE